jgi:FtsX-like permease family
VLTVAWYRFRATFRRRWPGYLSIVLLIGLVGGLAMESLVAARRTESSYPTFLARTNPSDLLVQPTTKLTCASGFVGQIARLPHVKRVGCALALNAATLTRRGGLGTVLLTQVELVASTDGLFSDHQDRVTITAGRAADPARVNEVVASPTAAALFGLHVGSHLKVGVDCESAGPGCPTSPTAVYRTVQLTVVGIGVFNIQVVQDDIDRGHTGFLLGTPALAKAFGPCCTNVTYDGLRLAGGSRDDTVVEKEYAHLLGTSSFTAGAGQQFQVYDSSVIEAEAQRAIGPEAVALGVFGIIAALAALLIGIQAISRQLQADAEEVSVLRAVGAGPGITSTDGLLGVVGAVFGGTVLAAVVAIGLSPLALFGPVHQVEPSPGFDLDWTVLGFGAMALVFVLGGVAGLITYRGAPHRITAHRRADTRGSRVVRAAVAGGLPVAGVSGLRFALDAGRGRSSVPVRSIIVGAVLAITVVTATLTFGASLNTLISHPSLYGWNFDYALYSTDGYGPIPSHTADSLLAHDPQVVSTSGAYFATVQIDGRTIPAMVESSRAALAPPILTGHAVDGSRQIVLGPATLAQLHQRIGDSVVLRGVKPQPIRLRIVGTATLPTIGTTLGIHQSTSTGAVISTQAVPSALLNSYGPFSGPNAIFIRLRPGADQVAARLSLERIAQEIHRTFKSPQATATFGPGVYYGIDISLLTAERPAEIVNYRSMGTTPGVLAGGLALGAVVALGLTLVASVRRRRRELALLKTFGFTQRQLAVAIASQSTVIAIVGLVIGIPLGIALGRILWDLFARQLSVVADATVPIILIVLVAVGTLALANFVAAFPGRRAARTPTALVLRAE